MTKQQKQALVELVAEWREDSRNEQLTEATRSAMAYVAEQVTVILNMHGDEPMFVVRAHDRVAPATVREWARRAYNIGCSEAKFNNAMEVALAMEKWQQAHGCKTPD